MYYLAVLNVDHKMMLLTGRFRNWNFLPLFCYVTTLSVIFHNNDFIFSYELHNSEISDLLTLNVTSNLSLHFSKPYFVTEMQFVFFFFFLH